MFTLFCIVPAGHMITDARNTAGVIEELSFVAGGKRTEQLSHVFTSLLLINHYSLKCIHA